MSFRPLVSPERTLREMTVKAFVLGIVLSAVLAAANAYIGLLVGMTVSASIPAAACSMGFLRLFRQSTILENNMVQTSASSGEALAGGMIFTMPALVMMHAWSGYDWGPMVVIAILGGILGVVFTIPLRRTLIVESDLSFPEGVATSKVLQSGPIETNHDHPDKRPDESSRRGFKLLLQSAAVGGGIKLLSDAVGLLAGGFEVTRSLLAGKWLFSGGITMSPALLAVGYIVGFNVGALMLLGGVIGTTVGIPLNWVLNSQELLAQAGLQVDSWSQLSLADWQTLAGESWQQCRRIGVGAMMIGGLWSLIVLAKPLVRGLATSFRAYRQSRQEGHSLLRTEHDIPVPYLGLALLVSTVPLYFLFLNALEDFGTRFWLAGVMTVLMLVFGFIFSSIAGYMAGLVGSSNNPISGVTIATTIVAALILLQLMGNDGMAHRLGPIAVIYLAGLICTSAAIASDNMQDLKCGHLLGATPWKQQIFQITGVIAAALVIPVVLHVLDQGYGIGRTSPLNPDANPLPAPQAGLIRDLSTGIFGAGIEWGYIYLGFALAVVLIILDEIQKRRGASFRFPVLAVAIGIYLPLGMSVPIFIGGALHLWQKKRRGEKHDPEKGLLIASGLITGEALMGVVIALLAVLLPGKVPFISGFSAAEILGGVAFLLCFVYLARKS